jgi:uncharacterized protein (TIGR03089 family)
VEPGRPFLTYYDDATGERTELSYATFANWVAKTANLLVDGLDLAPGETVGVVLPDHWQTVVVAFGAWRAGARVVTGTGDVTFAAEDALGGLDRAAIREVVGVSLRPMAAPLSRVWPGVTDYAAEVAAYADRYDADATATAAPVAEADALAESLGLDERSRVLVDGGDLLLAALAASRRGAGLVLLGSVAKDLDRLRETERVTHSLGR